MRYGARLALVPTVLAAALLAGGCTEEPKRLPPVSDATPTAEPSYDATLEPAAAVLALVPEEARTLTVTDFDRLRSDLGVPELTGGAAAPEVRAFWDRAAAEQPMLSPGMLRPAEPRLSDYGISQLDVAWEAHFLDASGAESGWVLALRDGTDMAAVERAVADGVGPLAGGTVDAGLRLVTSGTTDDPQQSWAADAVTREMVGLPAISTYLGRGCAPVHGVGGPDIEELEAYSVQFEGSLVTARLGEGRRDLFTRMRLGEAVPEFAAAYDGGVADPRTGRIGYVMADPPAAARLALAQALPFATCA